MTLTSGRDTGGTAQASLAAMAGTLTQLTARAQQAAEAQAALAKMAVTVTKALKNMIAGFDELHIAVQDSANSTAAKKGSSRKGGSKKAGTGDAKTPMADTLANMRDTAQQLAERLRALLSSEYLPSILAWAKAFTQVRAAAVNALSAVRESAMTLWQNALAPLGNYLAHEFLPSIANGFSTAFAPIFADVAEGAMTIFADGFAHACAVAESAINTLLLPALQLVQQVFTDVFAAVQRTWDTYGAALISGMETAFTNVFDLLQSLYEQILQPILAGLIAALATLWTEHLAPLWENLTQLLAEAGTALLTFWNDVLSPFLQFLIDTLSPVLASLGESISTILGGVLGTAADVVSGIITALRGLCAFLTGVFTGDWARAWDGVKTIFGGVWSGIAALLKGAVNSIIDCVNAMTRGVASAINGVVAGLNGISVTIPAWVPVYGGQHFGVNVPSVSAPQIPRLARGAVIPPNAEFLAVLGDQKSGRNLEAPEALLRQVVREESGVRTLTAQQPVELSLDGDVFYRAMLRIEAQRGVQIGGAFAYVD